MTDRRDGPEELSLGENIAGIAVDEAADGSSNQKTSILDQVEPLEQYRPGGFIPLKPGDKLAKDRLLVLQKLGFGRTAVVWLCQENATSKWFAIKVNSAETSGDDAREVQAARILRSKGASLQGNAGAGRVVLPLESFHVESPNGRHLCSVLPVLGPGIMDWRRYDILGDVDRTRSLCRQVAEGLDYIHSKGLCHGDFRPQNIYMKLRPGCLDGMEPDDVWNLLGEPARIEAPKVEGQKNPHMPEWIVTPAPAHSFTKYATDDIGIIDFGDAYAPSPTKASLKTLTIPKALSIPRAYAAPEAAFDVPGRFGKGTDVWALACTLMEVRRGEPLGGSAEDIVRNTEWLVGEALPSPYRTAAERMLAEAKARSDNGGRQQSLSEETITSLDASARDAQTRTKRGLSLKPLTPTLSKLIDNAQKSQKSKFSYVDPLEILVGQYMMHSDRGQKAGTVLKALKHPLPQEEVVPLIDLLRGVFKYDPEDRISARDVVRHEWLGLGRSAEVSTKGNNQIRGIPYLVWVIAAIIAPFIGKIIASALEKRNLEVRAARDSYASDVPLNIFSM